MKNEIAITLDEALVSLKELKTILESAKEKKERTAKHFKELDAILTEKKLLDNAAKLHSGFVSSMLVIEIETYNKKIDLVDQTIKNIEKEKQKNV